MTFVDSNVLFDVITADPVWASWSLDRLGEARRRGPVMINPTVFAELSVRFATLEQVEALVAATGLIVAEASRPALFLAGKAHLDYRRRGGAKTGVLPDFFIGAQAALSGNPLLTRDRSRYAAYFPGIRLITPDTRH